MSKPGTLILAGIAAAVVWAAPDVLLVAFAGILFAVFLRGLAAPVGERLRLPDGVSLALVLLLLASAGGACFVFLAPRIATQIDELTQKLPQSFEKLKDTLSGYEWGQSLLSDLSKRADEVVLRRGEDLLARATGIVSTTFGVLTSLVVVFVLGVFFAAGPARYTRGVVRLVAPERRERMAEVITVLGSVLRWWLFGKAISMAGVGFATALGLWLLDVPLALTLSLLAALLTFVPALGPLLSLIPAALLALTVDPVLAIWVVGLFAGVQAFETYLLTPLVQEKTVRIPAGLTIFMQVLLGVLLGPLGVLLAAPLTAVLISSVHSLYVEDVLENPDRS